MSVALIIVLVVWLLGAAIGYKLFISEWNYPTWEKVWFSIFWPCILMCYGVYLIYSRIR